MGLDCTNRVNHSGAPKHTSWRFAGWWDKYFLKAVFFASAIVFSLLVHLNVETFCASGGYDVVSVAESDL